MTPAEAGAVRYEEPDWREVFERECARKPRWPRYLQAIDAHEATMREWRMYHWIPVEVGGVKKKRPAPAVDAIVALAKLGIMPPRSEYKDLPQGGLAQGPQQDDHCWLSISGEPWRIVGIEDRMLLLEGMTWVEDEKPRARQIDLNKARWDAYNETAIAVLKARMEYENNHRAAAGDQGQAASRDSAARGEKEDPAPARAFEI